MHLEVGMNQTERLGIDAEPLFWMLGAFWKPLGTAT